MGESAILNPVKEVARRLGVSERQVKYLVASGEIPSCKFGKRRMVHEAHLQAFANRVAGIAS